VHAWIFQFSCQILEERGHAKKFYTAFTRVSQLIIGYNEYCDEFHAHIFTEKNGTHLSNLNFRRKQIWDELSMQVNHNHESLSETKHSLEQFFLSAVVPSCERRGIDLVDRVDLFESLIKDNTGALFVQSCCDHDQTWFLDLVAERHALISRRGGIESAPTDKGMDSGVHFSHRLGRDTMSMGDRGNAGGIESAATDEGKDSGVHFSHRLGRDTMSMVDHGMESAATDEGMDSGVHFSHRLGRNTMSMGDRGIESTATDEGMDSGVHFSDRLGRDTMPMVDRCNDGGIESTATDEGKDSGVHFSDRLGRNTMSMGDRGNAGGIESTATDEGKDRGVHYSDRLGRDTMSNVNRGKQSIGRAKKGKGLYYLLQEFNYNNKLVNRVKDRFTESINSIGLWFISKNIASGYKVNRGVMVKINAAKLNENGHMFLYPKNKNDNRRWKLTRVKNAPDGVKKLDNQDISEFYS
jgi:hypothetical protein